MTLIEWPASDTGDLRSEKEMPLVCATYSIESHLARRAFVADVMLYDQLVIPVPDKNDDALWKSRDPERQERLIRLMGKRVIPIVWDKTLREKWLTQWDAAKAVGADAREGLNATANVLLESVPISATGVATVAAFSSPEEMQKIMRMSEVPKSPDGSLQSLGIGTPSASAATFAGRFAAVIGREFLVPNDPERSDEDLLQEALDLSDHRAFKRKRAAYWRWQDEMLNRAIIRDQSALSASIEEMAELIEEEKKAVVQSRIRLGVSCAFAVAAASVGMFAGPITPIELGGAFLSVGAWAFDHISVPDPEVSPAAMCYTAQQAFGWRR